jgi:hypothetical protein
MHIKFEADTPVGVVQFSGDIDEPTQKALLEFAIITLWMMGELEGATNVSYDELQAKIAKEKGTIN